MNFLYDWLTVLCDQANIKKAARSAAFFKEQPTLDKAKD
ncbi:MAG: hypothetical protein RLZZ139_2582 [Cyanobacteriota bacterium]|jgi:hypothetical protein